ncbi:thioredoxin family protein [Calycomorphotria hydatis]|uniref:Thioredoxin n=1 Tax=Calycomorphotria hydatis TaxID=2528027 RepID=A0A517TCW0_9PLAN|nr:thioredoxin family protein [Calycomorphotria hydatis]QDT66213.1 Thioredoxin [Calycomorphotria hydatis]
MKFGVNIPKRSRLMRGSILLSAILCVAAGHHPGAWLQDFEQGLQRARLIEQPLVIHFYAPWCGPCKRMEREVLHTPEVVSMMGQRVVGVQLNTEQNRDLAGRWGVSSIPADVFLTPDGRVLGVMNGFRNKSDYVRRVSAINEYYQRTQYSGPKLPKIPTESRPQTEPELTSTNPRSGPKLQAPQGVRLLGMKGYCPVSLHRSREWRKGRPEFNAEHQGITYFLSSAEDRQRFLAEPIRYAPRLLGCDPVLYFDQQRAVPGKIEHAALLDQTLYLFASAENVATFRENPENYTKHRAVVLLEELELPKVRSAANSPIVLGH